MHEPYISHIPSDFQHKVLLCEVGKDTYGNPKNPELIDKVWRWAKENKDKMGIREKNQT